MSSQQPSQKPSRVSHPADPLTYHILHMYPNLAHPLATILSKDLQYRLKDIILDAKRFAEHAKRKTLTAQDINLALKQRNIQPLYGYQQNDSSLVFHKLPSDPIFYIPTEDISITKLLQASVPKLPVGPTVSSHWLAVEGVQPRIPQNPIYSSALERERAKRGGYLLKYEDQMIVETKDSSGNKKLLKHVLSAEQRMYFEKVAQSISPEAESYVRDEALRSISEDPGLDQLLPYFCQFIRDEIASNLRNLPYLFFIIQMAFGLLKNPHHHIELYLHQLLPSIFTCLVSKTLSLNPLENHWKLRNMAADILAFIVRKFGTSYNDLETRIARTLMVGLLEKVSRTTQYGSIVGIKALGPQAIKLLLLEPMEYSNLRLIVDLLKDDLSSDDMIIRHESSMCFAALLECCSVFFAYVSQFLNPPLLVDSELITAKYEAHDDIVDETTQKKERKSRTNDLRSLNQKLKEQFVSFAILPEEVNIRYGELYDIFGDAILPYINYDAYPTEESMLAMDVVV